MKKIDPVSTEIIRNAFISIAEDMNAALIRSAYTPVIYEGKDCVVALLDENGNVLGQSSGLPLFLGNLEICVKGTAEMYGWDCFKPGDIFFVNDSYFTGTHLNDATIFAPIYLGKTLVGFSASRAHWLDIGGKDPGGPMDSINIYQEGFRWAPTKIHEKNKPRKDIIEFLKMNGRFGYTLEGDLNAQIAAGKTGEIRFLSVIERFGLKNIKQARDEIFKQSEIIERKTVKKIKNGTYVAEGYLDNDGITKDPIKMKMIVKISGEKINIDLAGSSLQKTGPVNCGFAQTVSACRVAFKNIVNPDRPVDGGTFKTLSVSAPKGSIFRATEPAACQWYFSILGLLIDGFIKALSPVMKNNSAAGHYGDSMVFILHGVDHRNNSPFIAVEPTPGGWGAWNSGDGADALINNVNGAFKDIPIEIYESKYPVTIKKYGIRDNTGGPGSSRGGCGLYKEYTLNTDLNLSLWFERSKTTGWGLFGGKDGIGPKVSINHASGKKEYRLKSNSYPLKKGTKITTYTGGGGGFGNPSKRNPSKVLNDVVNGYVSKENAKKDYKVILTSNFKIDIIKTNQLRKKNQSLKVNIPKKNDQRKN